MKASFRNRIFQLLLIFAVIPAVLVTIFGYYLATRTPFPHSDETGEQVVGLTDYYHDLLYEEIARELDRYHRSGIEDSGTVDFLFAVENGRPRALGRSDTVSEEVMTSIGRTSEEKPRGLVAHGNRYFQYVSLKTGADTTLFAGFVHDESFGDLLDQLQQNAAAQSVSRELRGSYVIFIGGLFLTIVLITIAAAYFFSSRVSRNLADPLTALSDASRRIADGDFRQSVTVRGEGEIQTLIESFNRMTARLDQATSRLAQTERVAAWRQVARRFAHELKNPLQPILVSLYRIEQKLGKTEVFDEVRESLRAASGEVKHLTLLAERFSALARLPEPKLEPVELTGLIRSVVDLYAENLKPYAFSLNLPGKETVVSIDEAYIREALHNLLQNAMDACREGDAITLSLSAGDDAVEISVSDTGVGMDPATLASARLPYFTTREKGTGLGLAIVEKSIAELGGQLQVESGPGVGTTVTINLPGRKV